MAATDDAVWAVGPARVLPDDDVDVAIARFDPQAYGWVPGPVFPAAPGAYPAFMGPLSVSQPLLWTGTEIVIWDPEGGGGAAFDPGALAWRPLPAPTGRGAAGSRAVVAAGELVVVAQSGEGLAIGRVEDGAWTWRDLALSVGDVAAVTAAAAGEWVVLLLPGQGPVTYHVPTGAWAQHVDAPLADLQAPNTVWTGDRLIVWGGAAPSSPHQPPLAAGAVWIPPGG